METRQRYQQTRNGVNRRALLAQIEHQRDYVIDLDISIKVTGEDMDRTVERLQAALCVSGTLINWPRREAA